MPPLPDELDSWLATCACKKMLSEPPTETNKQLPEIQYAQIFFFFLSTLIYFLLPTLQRNVCLIIKNNYIWLQVIPHKHY